MAEITLNEESGTWSASATPDVQETDVVVLFHNASPTVPCRVVFYRLAAFGIQGICLAPGSVFPLVYRGGGTVFEVFTDELYMARYLIPPDYPTIPPS